MDPENFPKYLKEILNPMNDGLLLVSPDGIILMANHAMEDISGYSREEMVGQHCSIFHSEICQNCQGEGHQCQLFDGGFIRKELSSLVRKDGSYVHVLKNAALLKDDDGTTLGAVVIVADISEIEERDQKIERLSKLLESNTHFQGMVGKSEVMQRVFEVIRKAAQSEAPVIIYGETGTGKELVAHAIHNLGPRRDKPYIQLNCAALNEGLLESEMFGHVKGAFTGAHMNRQGRFEAANGGDIFLDEIGDIPLSIQIKLLRILETKQFERVGDYRPIKTDVRIITATNRDLDQLITEGKFREDFFFRINVVPISLPPLRDRTDDIPLLVEHFIRQLQQRSGKEIFGAAPETMDFFMNYRWPGNARELRGALEYAFVVAEGGQILLKHLPVRMIRPGGRREISATNHLSEKEALADALIKCGGNQTRAAAMLGVNRVTVWHRIKKYGIDPRNPLSSSDDSVTNGRMAYTP
ncbi:MAG: sigma 54-interacting transcriptional regulator [Syntrophobacteraceae bacterium]|jgi:PAS domain S-box-containing protein